MRALIDTCVVIDALQERKPFSEEAKELILLVANQALDGFLTAKSLADIHYIMRRSTHDEQVTRKMLSDLFELFEVLDTRGIDCRMAIASGTSDFEDAIMIETALRSGMDCIVTRNQKDYTQAQLPVYHPAELLRIAKTE